MDFGTVHAADFWVKAQWTIGHIQDTWKGMVAKNFVL
jgi:hypothetical protein